MRPYLRPEAHAPDAGGAWAQQELLPRRRALWPASVAARARPAIDPHGGRRLAEFPCENLAPLPIDDFMRAFFSLANRPPPPGLAAALELARTRARAIADARGGRGAQTIDLTGGDDAVVADEGAVEVVHAEAADEAIEVVQERSLDDVLRERAARSGVIALTTTTTTTTTPRTTTPSRAASRATARTTKSSVWAASRRRAPRAQAPARARARRRAARPSSESAITLRSPSPFSSSASSSSLSSTPSLADDDEDAHRPRSPWSSLSDAATQERALSRSCATPTR